MENQIVSCGGMDCSVCSVLAMVNTIFRYLLDISAVLAVLLVVIAGFLYLLGKGDQEKQNQVKRTLIFAIFGFALCLASFIVVVSTYIFSGANNADGWYRVDCSSDIVESQAPENIANTFYLENKEDQITTSGNISEIVTGDKKIIRLDPSKIDTANIISDIQLMDPERKVNFFAANKTVPKENIINFRNVDLGYEKDRADDYQIQATEEYTADKLVDPKENLRPILSINTTDAEDSFRVEWGKDLEKFVGNYSITDKNGVKKITDSLKDVALVSELGNKDIYAFTSGIPSLLGSKYENCENSGGGMKELQNSCFADKEHYDNRNLQCSKIYNPVTACDCPSGYYLQGEKCASADDIKKQKKINGEDDTSGAKTQTCQDVSLEEHKCSSRCEGDKMMRYPEYVKDQCLDTLSGPQITKKSCVGTPSDNEAENQKCAKGLDQKSDQEKMKEAEDFFNKNGYTPDWYNKILEDKYGKEPGYVPDTANKINQTPGTGGGKSPTGTGPTDTGTGRTPDTSPDKGKDTGSTTDTGKTPDDKGKTPDTGPSPPDQGAGNFNPTPSFQELKECIGLKGDQIPYNGILVAVLNPKDPLNKRSPTSNSRMFYLSRYGEVIGKNGVDIGKNPTLGGQEYGARDFHKGASNNSMWGRGWKIFYGNRIYAKRDGSWKDECSFGSQALPNGTPMGYKIGSSSRNDQGNLGAASRFKNGGLDIQDLSFCGQHGTESSAGCATFGKGKSHCGFVNKSKKYMTKSDHTIMQINFIGEMDPVSGKFSSPDCGKIDYCGAKRSFQQHPGARKLRNDPNEGYDPNKEDDKKRMVDC